MASIIKANKLQDFAGNDILSSDGAGVITPNANGIKNVPAFFASLSSSQSLSHNTYTKIVCDSESFDTDTAYDTSTGRFTVPSGEAGKYYFCFEGYTYDSSYKQIQSNPTFYKNGSKVFYNEESANSNTVAKITAIIELDSDDYVELYAKADVLNNSVWAMNMDGTTSNNRAHWFGYKLVGV